MTAPARVFSPLLAQPPADVVGRIARGARVVCEPAPFGWRALSLVGNGLDLRLVDWSFEDDTALFDRVRAMQTKIVSATQRGPTAAAYRAHRLVGRARHAVDVEGFRIKDPTHQSFVLDYARLVFGIVEVASGVLDSQARWIVDRDGESSPGAGARPVPLAVERRVRTIARLAKRGVKIPEGLSLVESEEEALTCAPADAKLRALSLWRTFRETCGAPEVSVERDARVREVVEHQLTARERSAIAGGDRAVGGWGVEALWALLFVLGAVPTLGEPGVPCDAEAAMRALDALTRRGALDGGELRPIEDTLDALDEYQCLAWALAESRGTLPAPMNGGVVQWRLRALRWAVLDGFAAWDEVTLDA